MQYLVLLPLNGTVINMPGIAEATNISSPWAYLLGRAPRPHLNHKASLLTVRKFADISLFLFIGILAHAIENRPLNRRENLWNIIIERKIPVGREFYTADRLAFGCVHHHFLLFKNNSLICFKESDFLPTNPSLAGTPCISSGNRRRLWLPQMKPIPMGYL